jgi:hypothetical protein
MWQTPNQRIRAAANAKRRERERSRKPIHIKRILAQIELASPTPDGPSTKTDVRLMLNDLTPKGVGVFSPAALAAGQEVVILITSPVQINIKARVIWCQEHAANSHVISSQPFSYRVGFEFTGTTPDERNAIKAFCDEINTAHLYKVGSV